MINQSISIIQKIYQKIQKNPRTIGIHTTDKCNLSCKYCYSKKIKENTINWFHILKQAKKLNVRNIHFLGGEPFCDKNIFSYLYFCEKNNIHSTIYSNGLVLKSKEIAKLNKMKNIELKIKFDSKENLENESGKDTFNKIINIINSFEKSKISLHCFISKKNIENIREIMNSAKALNLPISFERYMPTNKSIDQEYSTTAQEYDRTVKEIANNCNDKLKYYTRAVFKGSGCSCYVDAMFISADGFVKPCPMASNEQNIGNVQNENLKEIWKKYKTYRKKWMQIPDECKSCKFKLLCRGGCKTHAFQIKKNYNQKDPLCLKKQIPTQLIFKQRIKK